VDNSAVYHVQSLDMSDLLVNGMIVKFTGLGNFLHFPNVIIKKTIIISISINQNINVW